MKNPALLLLLALALSGCIRDGGPQFDNGGGYSFINASLNCAAFMRGPLGNLTEATCEANKVPFPSRICKEIFVPKQNQSNGFMVRICASDIDELNFSGLSVYYSD